MYASDIGGAGIAEVEVDAWMGGDVLLDVDADAGEVN